MSKLPANFWRQVNQQPEVKRSKYRDVQDDLIFFGVAISALIIAAAILSSAGAEAGDLHKLFWVGVII